MVSYLVFVLSYFVFISSFGLMGKLCFGIVVFSGYLHLYFSIRHNIIELAHGKTYNTTCATSEDSDQTAHPRSLI